MPKLEDWEGRLMRNKGIMPFPPNPILNIVIEGARYLWHKFKEKKEEASNKIAQQKAMDKESASVDEVVTINKAFNELIQSLEGEIQKTEERAIEELAYFFEEFIDYMQEHEEMFMSRGIRVNKIVNKFEKVKRKLKGELSKKIYREISLDNVACREILAIRAGDRKKERMDDFIEKAFDKALHDLIYDIQDELLDIVEDIEIAVEEGLELIQANIHEKATIYKALEENIAQDMHNKEEIVSQAVFKIYAIEEIQEIINKGEV